MEINFLLPVSLETCIMEVITLSQGYQRKSKIHREIYLSDPRKTEPEKLKTVLRFQAEKRCL